MERFFDGFKFGLGFGCAIAVFHIVIIAIFVIGAIILGGLSLIDLLD